MKLKALVFDFDGVLVNTQELVNDAYKIIFFRRGMKVSNKMLVPLMGKPIIFNMRNIREKYGFGESAEELVEERDSILMPLIDQKLKLLTGAREVLEMGQKLGLKLAIASGNRHPIIEDISQRLGFLENFSAIAATEDLVKSQGKPDPEIFLIAAEKLVVGPEECAAVGDAPNDMKAAKAAGMKAIYVPDTRYVELRDANADVVLNNLGELTHDVIRSLE